MVLGALGLVGALSPEGINALCEAESEAVSNVLWPMGGNLDPLVKEPPARDQPHSNPEHRLTDHARGLPPSPPTPKQILPEPPFSVACFGYPHQCPSQMQDSILLLMYLLWDSSFFS